MEYTEEIKDITGEIIGEINSNDVNSTLTPLNLFGTEYPESLNQYLNQNFLLLLQNFASETPPLNPLKGQSWFNTIDEQIYLYNGVNWKQTQLEPTYDIFVFYYPNPSTEIVLDESVFNLTLNNTIVLNENMESTKFIIDTFDSKKIILKESVENITVIVFHPNDKLSNLIKNTKKEFIAQSGQTQFDIGDELGGTDVSTLSVLLNDVLLKPNEFNVVNNTLTIDGKIYRVNKNDILTVYKYGGSIQHYYSSMIVKSTEITDTIKIPKMFQSIKEIIFYDEFDKVILNPLSEENYPSYIEYKFMQPRKLKAEIQVKLI